MTAVVEPEVKAAPQAAWRRWDRISPKRSLTLCAVGAIVGLAAAGEALFTARGATTLIVPAEDVALVNGQAISRSDYLAGLRALYDVAPSEATPAQRRKVLDDLITEELMVQRGRELDVAAADPDVRAATANAVEQSVAADALTKIPAPEALRAYYAAHKDRYADEGVIVARDLVFPPAVATAAGRALAAGRPAETVLAQFGGRDGARTQGEEFYFAARIHLGEALFDAARRTPSGKVSAPVVQPDGTHFVQVLRNRAPTPLSYEAALPSVRDDYIQAAIKRLQTQHAEFLRKRSSILVAPDFR
ncbi:peptidyl-prolyl cis-trans isomerase [Phenylobacterium sp. LjRoot225]|uniref:peptidyl-prolyl cis-trans isomerase n=1 Tax=Phenylobacterium sp. LjRoot225 TaxID=3342285 RepID=UPI003ECC6A14